MIQATLCFVFQGSPHKSILLGYKKRGFAQGKVDGFGGKVKPGEPIAEAAARELAEETGLTVLAEDLCAVGVIRFVFPYKPEWDQEVHVFVAQKWAGIPSESEEMRPAWFSLTEIPYERMWDDSHYWMPRMLAGEKIHAQFTYQQDNATVDHYHIQNLQ